MLHPFNNPTETLDTFLWVVKLFFLPSNMIISLIVEGNVQDIGKILYCLALSSNPTHLLYSQVKDLSIFPSLINLFGWINCMHHNIVFLLWKWWRTNKNRSSNLYKMSYTEFCSKVKREKDEKEHTEYTWFALE